MAPARIFVPTQPKRCAGQETGLTGTCLACGSPAAELCRAPIAERYTPGKRRGAR